MFTGIIETTGIIKEVISTGQNKTFWVESSISSQLKEDQSVSHDGVCLTVEEIINGAHRVTAIEETIKKTNLSAWVPGQLINLERCLPMNGRLDGHLVQGHVDATGICISKKEMEGSWEFEFEFPGKFANLVVEKGSVCINGISLTCFKVKKKSLRVAIIPYTFENTNIKLVKEKDLVNFEFDILGKYVARAMQLNDKK